MQEIVAARIGSVITNDPTTIVAALETDTITEFIDRRRMQFMAALDLGPQWETLARSRTLFLLDDDSKPYPVIKE